MSKNNISKINKMNPLNGKKDMIIKLAKECVLE
jgi:hypothetical protein